MEAQILTVMAVLALPAAVGLFVLWRDERKLRKECQSWLSDEINAHEKTKQALREAAARMRRENRDRVLGLIAGQRAE